VEGEIGGKRDERREKAMEKEGEGSEL